MTTKELNAEMEKCKKEMFDLFTEEDLATQSFLNNLNKIHNYYLLRAPKKKTTLEEYQLVVEAIKLVKEGTLSSTEGLKYIKDLSCNRKLEVVIANILKACELLFWMATAFTSYVFCLGFALPVALALNPPLGIALTLGASAVMLAATLKGVDCVREFESFQATNQQEKLESNALTFFDLQKTINQSEIDPVEEFAQHSLSCG